MTTHNLSYRAEIDGLRAVAVSAVILFHAGIELLGGGFLGVDVFFVLSGYLITRIVCNDISTGNFSFYAFFVRRARRLLPALFFVLLATSLAAFFLFTPAYIKDLGQSIVATVVYASNILFYLEDNYFAPAAEVKPLLHTWSLAIEEQFYILFPALLVIAHNIKASFRIVVLILFCCSFGVALLLPISEEAKFYLLWSRAWELLFGGFIALSRPSPEILKAESPWLCRWMPLVGLVLILFSILSLDGSSGHLGWLMLLPVFGTGLILWWSSGVGIVHMILSRPFMVYIGLISYSLYLVHQPVFAFARVLFAHPSNLMIFSSILCTVGFALASYYFVEKPFRNRTKFADSRIVFVACAASFIFLSVGMIFAFFPTQVSKSNPYFAIDAYDNLEQARAHRLTLIRAGECQFNGRDVVVDVSRFIEQWNCIPEKIDEDTILVFGDSVAADVAASMRMLNMNIAQITAAGCPLDSYDGPAYCEEVFSFMEAVLDSNGITKVLLANYYGKDELSEERLSMVVSRWKKPGVTVALMPPPVEFPSYEKTFLEFSWKMPVQSEIKKLFLPPTAEMSGVQQLPSYQSFCEVDATYTDSSDFCRDFFSFTNGDDQRFTRTDKFHLSEAGMILLSQYLEESLLGVFSPVEDL
jgi:peptidoglycan/LPS O-acetylase OafA/YrhL